MKKMRLQKNAFANKNLIIAILIVFVIGAIKVNLLQSYASTTASTLSTEPDLLVNGGFESNFISDQSWTIQSDNINDVVITYLSYANNPDITPIEGEHDFNYFNANSTDTHTLTVSQTITGLEEGYYRFSGSDMGVKSSMTLTAQTSKAFTGGKVSMTQFNEWHTGNCDNIYVNSGESLTVTINIEIGSFGYGHLDGFSLIKKDSASLLNNGGFESDFLSDHSWDIDYNINDVLLTHYLYADNTSITPIEKSYDFNYYNGNSTSNEKIKLSQTIYGLEDGYYSFTGYGMGQNGYITLSAVGSQSYTGNKVALTSFDDWHNIACKNIRVHSGESITLTIVVDAGASGYGHLDGFTLLKQDDYQYSDGSNQGDSSNNNNSSLLINGGFESDFMSDHSWLLNYDVNDVTITYLLYSKNTAITPNEGAYNLNYYNQNSTSKKTVVISQSLSGLDEGYYTFSGYDMGQNSSVILSVEGAQTNSGNQVDMTKFNEWHSVSCENIMITQGENITVKIQVEIEPNGYGHLDGFKLVKVTKPLATVAPSPSIEPTSTPEPASPTPSISPTSTPEPIIPTPSISPTSTPEPIIPTPSISPTSTPEPISPTPSISPTSAPSIIPTQEPTTTPPTPSPDQPQDGDIVIPKLVGGIQRCTLEVNDVYTIQMEHVLDSAIVTYHSSNKAIASVNSVGKVKAKKAGKVTITISVKQNGINYVFHIKFIITNTDTGTIHFISNIKVGESIQLNKDLVENNQDILWITSNKKIATVDKKGKVTGKKKGIVLVSGISENKIHIYIIIVQ